MLRKRDHHGDVPAASSDDWADEHLADDGLSFDFNAGERTYRTAIGGSEADVIGGSEAFDHSFGLGGTDEIGGGPEDDVLRGDEDGDLLSGNQGRDLVDGGAGDDTLYGGAAADNMLGREGDDWLDEGAGHSGIAGGPGDDTLVGGQGPDAFIVDPTSGDDVIKDFTAGPGMFDHIAFLHLQWEDLKIEDTDRGVKISWEPNGSVLLEGVWKSELAQDDFMFATSPDLPPGDREIDGPTDERSTRSKEGPEIDASDRHGHSSGRGDSESLAEDDPVFGFDRYTVAVGGDERDELEGGATFDHFFGRGGDDRLAGNEGDDVLEGDDGKDELDGGPGMDRLDGGAGDDTLVGGDQTDELMGGDGNDELDEGAGHGMIEGGRGDDTLTGGGGADAFIVSPDSGDDRVTDFVATGDAQGAFDHIALRDIMPEDVSVTDTDEGALVAWDVDHDEEADGSILLAGVAKDDLRQSDFMFVAAPGFVEGINDFGSHYIFPEPSVIA